MKKNAVIATLALMLGIGAAGFLTFSSCGRNATNQKKEESKISYYTCPMHPFVHEEKEGDCPICHMKLVPVYRDETSPPSSLLNKEKGAEGGGRSVSISTERQQLIGVTTAPVEKRQISKEIQTVGRVAFDPDLAIAQREFVEIARNVPSLKSAAVQRLKLLGMADDEIRDLEKSGHPQTNLYLPEEGDSVWVYIPLYEYEVPFVKVGDTVSFTGPSIPNSMEGLVRAIDRVVDPMTRSVRARIELPGAGGKIKPESYLNASLQVDLGEQLVVPKPSVIDTGTRQIVFVVHDGKTFESREVKLGPEAGENRVILEGLKPGEIVATSAAFLIDSESQLKAAVSSSGKSGPSCPEGEAWDAGMSMCMPKVGS